IGETDISRADGGSGVLGAWKSGRQGIALKPDAYDGDRLFNVPFVRVKRSEFPAGRGIFVHAGTAVTMHVQFVREDEHAAASASRTQQTATVTPVGAGG